MSARTVVSLFKAVALLEGVSWLGLLIGMYLKYVADAGERGVQIFGPIHGGVFVAYVVLTLLTARLQRWPWWTLLLGLAASIPPFGTVLFETWAQRSGRLSPRRSGPQAPAAAAAA